MNILNEISPVLDVLKNLSERGIKCNLLVGAGCSVSAGIPTASGIVDIIKQKFPSIYSMVKDKSYANCMNALSPDERIYLIKSLVNDSKLNITHIIIAELLKRGYVHRILTPNFDNLLIKACSVVNEFPPIYDLAAYEEFKPEHIPEKCIFYLHGQFTGFKLMNTREEVNEQAKKLTGLFHRLNERSVWIIVGFSGQNDALFELLSAEPVYSNRLFWVGHNYQEPHYELATKILKEGKYGFYIKGFDSDDFFWNLAKRLDAFPPVFLLKPFSYIKNILEQIVPYQPNKNEDLNTPTNNIIQNAIDKYENDPIFVANCYYNSCMYDNVIGMEEILIKKKQNWLVASAYFNKAYALFDDAVKNESVELFKQVIVLYDKSKEVNLYHGCFNNSGLCYYNLAKIEKENFEANIFEGLERYLSAIEHGNVDYAWGNFLDAVNLFLDKQVKNKNKLLNQIKKVYEDTVEQKLNSQYFEWAKFTIEKLTEMKFKDDHLDQYLQKFMEFAEKKIERSA